MRSIATARHTEGDERDAVGEQFDGEEQAKDDVCRLREIRKNQHGEDEREQTGNQQRAAKIAVEAQRGTDAKDGCPRPAAGCRRRR